MTKAEALMRRTGITAAEGLGLAGLSPLTPKQIYRLKMKPKVPAGQPFADLRKTINLYASRSRHHIFKRPMFRNPVMRFALTEAGWRHSDGVVIPVRVKNKAPWISLPPEWEATAQWTLGATGLERADVVVLYGQPGNFDIRSFSVKFNSLTFCRLYSLAEHFMVEHVLQKVPPQ